jgi:hypothetical protein
MRVVEAPTEPAPDASVAMDVDHVTDEAATSSAPSPAPADPVPETMEVDVAMEASIVDIVHSILAEVIEDATRPSDELFFETIMLDVVSKNILRRLSRKSFPA